MIILLLMSGACKKTETKPPENTHPQMTYTNLLDSAIHFNHFASFDLDGNGEKDIAFSTLLVGDPIYQQDKWQWWVSSSIYTNLPVNGYENIPVLDYLDSIPIHDFSDYQWFNASYVMLAQKIISITNPPYWDGTWKESSHHYVPIQIKKDGELFNGWVEISFNTKDEMVILHQAAVSQEPYKAVMAGKL
jgi:hypothetical protein